MTEGKITVTCKDLGECDFLNSDELTHLAAKEVDPCPERPGPDAPTDAVWRPAPDPILELHVHAIESLGRFLHVQQRFQHFICKETSQFYGGLAEIQGTGTEPRATTGVHSR